MDFLHHWLFDAGIVLLLFVGIGLFRSPRTARSGNWAAAAALALAILIVLLRHEVSFLVAVAAALALGGGLGLLAAVKVTMLQIPAMVAFQHGMGGVAAFLISSVELWRGSQHGLSALGEVSGLAGLAIGAATFSGSIIASGKLIGWMKPQPRLLPRHGVLTVVTIALVVAIAVITSLLTGVGLLICLAATVLISVGLGVVVSIRIGGADMPVLISFLNATAGFAAAFCGVILGSHLLVACGATVAASGSILTHVMCKAMNRNIFRVFLGFAAGTKANWMLKEPPRDQPQEAQADDGETPPTTPPEAPADPFELALEYCQHAERIIVVPGYGMAVAQAQGQVVTLANHMMDQGKQVSYAIHPVAGRMPGHMNVLLAEADVDYDLLREMDDVNPEFREIDLVLVVGACDVVNPAAISVEGTPISGMPILKAHEAKHVIVCNLDERPGYSGVPNPLYHSPNTVLLLGDAKETLTRLTDSLKAA
ncbi:MAG: NAD(P)(+) transhydrogenase (Re/Si-specific) subunit beta [Bradymonadales bacterium]|nr:NAD(P)(+) transhydrogenase (Re/Si-specific) subunit beta [Bradymonadales bacterium]